MEGPAVAPYFDPNPNNREEGWVNLTVGFLTPQHATKESRRLAHLQ